MAKILNIFDGVRHTLAPFYRASRRKKFRLFLELTGVQRDDRILDVGVDTTENNPFENQLERELGAAHRITAVTLGDARPLRRRYPAVQFVVADGCALPFRDGAFDVLISNAVIEHVGPEAAQRAFASETVRVAKCGMITTPNYWFPIELHTTLPLVHYLPWGIRRYIFLGLAGRENERYMSRVRLLSARGLRRLFPAGVSVRIIPVRAFVLPETLAAFFGLPR